MNEMENMIQIKPNELTESVIDLIGKEWLLVSAGKEGAFNTMTASWGMIGFMFNKNIATIVIRPERYTAEFLERESHFTLTVLEPEYRDALVVCGKNSGRDGDKVAKAGLNACFTEAGNPTFKESRVVLECRKIYSQMMTQDSFIDSSIYEQWYDAAHGGLHRIYMGEITGCWIKNR